MSDYERFTGKLVKIDLGDSSLEEMCKKLYNKELPSYYESFEEAIEDKDDEYIINKGILYKLVDKKYHNPGDSIFNAVQINSNEIKFEVMYYNGGCGFSEAIEQALKNMEKNNG